MFSVKDDVLYQPLNAITRKLDRRAPLDVYAEIRDVTLLLVWVCVARFVVDEVD